MKGDRDVAREASFGGDFDRRRRDARFGGQATYAGSVALSAVPASLVDEVLPSSLARAAGPREEKTHPILLLSGIQAELADLVGGKVFPTRIAPYRELILLVPYVVHAEDGNRWHSYALRMFLDNEEAVRAGNVNYAYAKALGRLTPNGDVYAEPSGQQVFESALAPGPADAGWMPAAEAKTRIDGYRRVFRILEMPIAGHGVQGDVCSYFEWDDAGAEVAPTTFEFRFVAPFRPEMASWPGLGALQVRPPDAFHVRGIQWRLSFELPYLPPNQPPHCRWAGA